MKVMKRERVIIFGAGATGKVIFDDIGGGGGPRICR